MKKLMLVAALTVFAAYPAMANMDNSQPPESIDSGTTEEMDTTLTEEPGILEEQNREETLDKTVDSSTSGTTINDHSVNNENYYFPRAEEDIQSGATVEGSSAPVNESMATAPRGIDNRGSWNLTAGPALTLGLESDNVLYGVSGGYTFNLTPELGARVFADANIGSGEDSAQFLALGTAAKLGMGDRIGQQISRAYLLGDVALASARNADTDNSETGVAVGAGVGYNFLRTERTDIDLLLRYSLMLSEVDDKLPSLLTARVGVNF